MKNKEEFKILSPRDHIRLRMNMYVGSSSAETVERFVLGEYKNVKYVPSLLKIIDEIIDNSIDEAIRTEFKHANKIDVSIDGETISITDNGRGIPQDIVVDENGTELVRPVAAWTRVNAGTSFSDERTSIGANGVGSSCTNFLSNSFIGKTWRDGNCVTVACSDGGLKIKVTNSAKTGSGTKVSFSPDFSLIEADSVNDYDTIDLLKDRLISLSMCFPEIKITFNGSKVSSDISNFTSYAKMFGPKGGSQYAYSKGDVSFLIAGSEDGFRQNCYINGVNTRLGGSYTDYIINNVIDELIPMIKRKYKVEVNKSTIKNGFTIVMFARNFVNPKYDSQTKERLTNTMSQVREHFNTSFSYDFKYIAKKIIDSEDLIGPIVEAQLNKKAADEARNTAIKQKGAKKVKVAKHVAATSKDATLFLTEGDCIEENTLIHTIDGDKPIKNVVAGDWVFTHKHRYRQVKSNSFSLKDGININGTVYSKEHRLFVYDSLSKEMTVKKVIDVNKETDKLVNNRYISLGTPMSPDRVVVVDNGRIVTSKYDMIFSDTHDIFVYDEKSKSIGVAKWTDLRVGDVVIL